MDGRSRALAIVTDAKIHLAKLAHAALESGRFGDAALFAEIAGDLTGIEAKLSRPAIGQTQSRADVGSGANEAGAPATLDEGGQHSAAHDVRRVTVRRKPRERYPRFFRVDDKVIKVGWSPKLKSEYEHRAPRAVVDSVVRALSSRRSPASRFTSEDVLTAAKATSGEPFPAYQVYVALAWLRSLGAIKQNGRDGYFFKSSVTAGSNLDELWNSLPVRA